jgi:hypothetical protein
MLHILCIILITCILGWQRVCSSAETMRAISFPPKAVGTFSYRYHGKEVTLPAAGTISVPENSKERTLHISYDSSDNLNFLQKLRPDDLDQLDLHDTAVTDDGCKLLPHLSRLYVVQLAGDDVGDQCIEPLTALPKLEYLDLQLTRVTDPSTIPLARLPLRYLNLSRTRITDSGVMNLANSTITILYLTQDKITDRACDALRKMQLENLELDQTYVTDVGVEKLAGMKHLSRLHLRNNPKITDASIPALSKLPLAELDIGRTGISEAGLLRLRRNLPHCKILHDQSWIHDR